LGKAHIVFRNADAWPLETHRGVSLKTFAGLFESAWFFPFTYERDSCMKRSRNGRSKILHLCLWPLPDGEFSHFTVDAQKKFNEKVNFVRINMCNQQEVTIMRKAVRAYRVGAVSFLPVFMAFIFIAGSAFGADISTSNKAPVGVVPIPVKVTPLSITPPVGYILENEPVCQNNWVDIWNGGCNSDPYVFETINCGAVILGTSGTYDYYGGSYRDTDWFQIDVTEGSDIVMQGMADFDVQFVIIDGRLGCDGVIVSSGLASAGQTLTIQAANVPAGTYWLWAGPQGFTGVPCGTQYWFSVSCNGITPIPTLSEWGMILLLILMAVTGIAYIRRARPRTV